jgi:hypothetical protein
MVLNFVPVARKALADAGGMKHLVMQLLRKAT